MADVADDDLDFLGMAARPLVPVPARVEEPAEPLPYDPELALRFFRVAGNQETIAAGTRIFAEHEQAGLLSRARVYLLLEGEVAMTLGGRPLTMMFAGETFGELAVISDGPRTATATARKNCRLLSLDRKQFLASLKAVPDFALMLISMMAERLRRNLEKLLATSTAPLAPHTRVQGLSHADLAELARIVGESARTRM